MLTSVNCFVQLLVVRSRSHGRSEGRVSGSFNSSSPPTSSSNHSVHSVHSDDSELQFDGECEDLCHGDSAASEARGTIIDTGHVDRKTSFTGVVCRLYNANLTLPDA